ncbi:MAG: hypothetical protein WC159_03470 [Sphaerochaetaceae bacterium]
MHPSRGAIRHKKTKVELLAYGTQGYLLSIRSISRSQANLHVVGTWGTRSGLKAGLGHRIEGEDRQDRGFYSLTPLCTLVPYGNMAIRIIK